MAGWLDELFNGAQFKGQDPKGLLEMLTQLAQTQAGPSAGFPPAGPPQMSAAGGGPMMPLSLAPTPDLPPPKDIAGLPQPPANLPVNPNFPSDAQGSAEPPTGAVSPAAAMAPPPGAAPFFPGQDVLARVGRHVLQTLHDNSNSMIAGGGAMISGGLGHGLSAMAAAAPLDIAARRERQGNQAIQATYDALIQAGHSPAEALAGSQNPEILKTLVAKPTWGVIGEDPVTGSKRYGFIDPISKTVSGPGGGGAGISGVPPGLEGPALGEWFKKNDPTTYAAIESIYRGDVNAGGRNLQKYLPYAALVHPDLHQFDYATRAKTRAFYTSGAGGLESKAANTAIEHAEQLSKIDEKLGGIDLGGRYANEVIQGAKGLYDSKFQDARREWEAKSETLATEVAKAINGGTPHVADKEHWRSVFAAASTPTQRKAAIRSVMEIIQGRQTAAEQNYAQGMGPAREGFAFISPENQQRYERLLNYGHEAPARSSSSSAGTEAPPAKAITKAEYDKLPKGAPYTAPDGSQRVKQ